MNRFSFRMLVGIITFLLCVTIVFVWFEWRSHNSVDQPVVVNAPETSPHSLFCAASQRNALAVKRLLDAGANPDETDDHGTCDGRPNVPTSISPRKVTPLMSAAGLGDTEVVKLLLDRGASVSAKDSEGNTAISAAAYYLRSEVVELLIERGADINNKDWFGQTVLMNAAGNGAPDTVRFLLDRSANLDVQNRNGTTALMFAMAFKHPDIAQLLLENGANSQLKDHRGRTAEAYRKFGYPKEYIVVRK